MQRAERICTRERDAHTHVRWLGASSPNAAADNDKPRRYQCSAAASVCTYFYGRLASLRTWIRPPGGGNYVTAHPAAAAWRRRGRCASGTSRTWTAPGRAEAPPRSHSAAIRRTAAHLGPFTSVFSSFRWRIGRHRNLVAFLFCGYFICKKLCSFSPFTWIESAGHILKSVMCILLRWNK